MAKKDDGSDEAAAARTDEQQRQARIRQGTARVNSIFGGNSVQGTGAVAAGTAYDPNATFYTADGAVWKPDMSSALATMSSVPFGASVLPHAGHTEFADRVSRGELFTGTAPQQGGFNDAFFDQRRQAYTDYANPQLEDQYGKAQKELTFALSRAGLTDSSVRAAKFGELQQKYDLNKQQIADEAQSHANQARNSIEEARANLIQTLNATGDAEGTANMAVSRAQALSRPTAFSPLSQLFSDFTAGLGTQAALEKANYYSGGQTGTRYNTGLFAPNKNAVQVS